MRIFSRSQISACLGRCALSTSLRQAFRDHVAGRVNTPPSAHLRLLATEGECHVRVGHIEGQDTYVVKVSNGFYKNTACGLASSSGLMAVFSAHTGETLAILDDQGLLTDLRTALSGAMATAALSCRAAKNIGIVGTGTQARLQLQETLNLMPHLTARVWGRTAERVADFQNEFAQRGIGVENVKRIDALCLASDILVTTTPTTLPLVKSSWIRPGTHITAVGSDSPEKQELEVDIVRRARIIVADTVSGSASNGEVAHALRAGAIDLEAVREMGDLFGSWQVVRQAHDITLADLSGSAVQDAAVAHALWRELCI